MPEKQCPECGNKVHVRKRECACGFVFPIKAKKSKSREANPDADERWNDRLALGF